MCGIVGIVVEKSINYKEILDSMVKKLHHRGPDANGTYYFENCALGHTRLSIVDINTGQQPMLSGVSGNGITFNGEIYGYKSIKNDLADYPFKTTSDTEVILALYDKYSSNMMSKLPGMFSFAIWDENDQKLFCARDRFGEKPFYYAIGNNNEFIFASEIKAILETGLVTPKLDLDSVGHYLKCMYVHPDKTIYKNVYVLPPAHQLVFKNGNINIKRYWDLPETDNNITEQEATEKFHDLFKKSIKKQLIADVPVGAFLSGGLDSSSVAIESSYTMPDIKTFSFGFNDETSELPYAREVAKMYNTDHIEITDTRDDLADLLLLMQDIYDDPFGDTSNIPTYLISKCAKEHGKVILTGDAADELLGGYVWSYRYLYDLSNENSMNTKQYIMNNLKYQFKKLSGHKDLNLKQKLRNFKNFRKNPVSDMHYAKSQFFPNNTLQELGLNISGKIDENWRKFSSNTVDDAMRDDICRYMAGDILVKIDRASMANGLELRAPFLDVELAEFCISLPYKYKIDQNSDKLPLRKSYADQWPQIIKNRPKQGFSIPINNWLNRPDFKELKNNYLLDKSKKIFDILNFDDVQNFYDFNDNRTWNLLALSLWLEKHSYSID